MEKPTEVEAAVKTARTRTAKMENIASYAVWKSSRSPNHRYVGETTLNEIRCWSELGMLLQLLKRVATD
jgi:hypothetical protein